jgi:NDP-4-keto-2,6-dideoxyhexose 3-C-methyltransferase
MRNICRACGKSDLSIIVDLGLQRLSDFRQDESLPDLYPLELMLCSGCSLVQLAETAPRDLMYHDGYGYKSGVNENLKANLSRLVDRALSVVSKPKSWLDIASNDGTLLSFVPKGTYRVGIDPVSKFKEEALEHADKIIADYFPPKNEEMKDKFDVITSSFMFYDVDDPNDFVKQVKNALAPDGVWLIQQNYLMAMLKFNTYDNISHEHIGYYCLTSMVKLLERNNLEVVDVYEDPINGGSFITIVRHLGISNIVPSVQKMLEAEQKFGVNDRESYVGFSNKIEELSSKLAAMISGLAKTGKIIDIYGASTRGATIWQKAGIDKGTIRYAVERQEGKVGKFFSAIQVPIVSEKQMRVSPPDYLLIGPWFLKELFIDREKEFLDSGGKMIFPLPDVEIITGKE